MKYERSITSGLEVMAKVKVFVHATVADADADADADGRAMTLAPRTYMSRLAKNKIVGGILESRRVTKKIKNPGEGGGGGVLLL